MLDERIGLRRCRYQASTAAIPVVSEFTQWGAVPGGGTTPSSSSDRARGSPGLHPWNFVAGNLSDLSAPHAVAIDRTYFGRLGVTRIGDSTEIREQRSR